MWVLDIKIDNFSLYLYERETSILWLSREREREYKMTQTIKMKHTAWNIFVQIYFL